MERGEWLNLTPVWVDRLAQKEEGLQKFDVHSMGASPIRGEGGRDAVFNHRVDSQMQIMERLGDITVAARSENLRTPWQRIVGRYAYASSQSEIASGPARAHMRLCGEKYGDSDTLHHDWQGRPGPIKEEEV